MTAPCPLCGAGSRILYALPNGEILRCTGCRVVFRGNLISGGAATDLYEDESYLETPYFDALKVASRRDVEPWLVYRRVLDRLEALAPENRSLLDVGSSYGAFLELARELGWAVTGVELAHKPAAYAAQERALDVFTGTLAEAAYPDDTFDAVTLWDVIEHLDDPLSTLREIRRILRPGGMLMLFTINQRSLINRVGHVLHRASFGTLKRPLVLLYDIHHNFFFDRVTLGGLLGLAGFGPPIAEDHLAANIDRWQNVPIPPLLALGTRCLDAAATVMGEPYRMILYVQK